MKKRYFILCSMLILGLFLLFSSKSAPKPSSLALQVPQASPLFKGFPGFLEKIPFLGKAQDKKEDQKPDQPNIIDSQDPPKEEPPAEIKVKDKDHLVESLIAGLNDLIPERTITLRGDLAYKPSDLINKIEAQTEGTYISAIYRSLEVKYETISILNKKTLQTKVIFSSNYHHSQEQESLLNQWVDQKILEWDLRDKTDYEKIRTIHDNIIASTSYIDTVNPSEGQGNNTLTRYAGISVHSPYSIVANGKGVCQSYASLFQKFCDRLSIPSKYIIGLASSDGAVSDHAWNKVQIDGAWYNIDLTWDDPVVDFNGVRVDRAFSGFESKKYFLKSDQTFSKDHQAKNFLELQALADY